MNRCVRIDRKWLDLRLLNTKGNSFIGVEHINNAYPIDVFIIHVDQLHQNNKTPMAAI